MHTPSFAANIFYMHANTRILMIIKNWPFLSCVQIIELLWHRLLEFIITWHESNIFKACNTDWQSFMKSTDTCADFIGIWITGEVNQLYPPKCTRCRNAIQNRFYCKYTKITCSVQCKPRWCGHVVWTPNERLLK